MAHIKIERLTDDHECETCGASWAEGANVYFDGKLSLELEPVAHCYGGDHYDDEEVMKRVLAHLGHTIEYA